MKSFNSLRFATNGLLVILSLFVLLHFSILIGIIPYEMVWGGRLQNQAQMLSFEGISIAVNLLMLGAVGIYAGLLKVSVNRRILQAALWVMFVLFLLNTLGNMLSSNEFEKFVFTPLTLLLSVFSLRLAMSKQLKAA